MGGGGTIYQPSPNSPSMVPHWASAKSIIADLLGISDIQRCSKGDIGSCAWTVAGILPFGKIAVLGRLVANGAKVVKSGEELLDAARAARNARAAEVGRSKATVIGGYSRDGRVVAGCSSNPVGCAEDDVARQLGGNPLDIKFTEAMCPRTGRQVPVCPRCQEKCNPEQFPSDILFDPSGAWGSR